MLCLLQKAFPEQMKQGWEAKLKEMVPSYGQKINDSAAFTNEIRRATSSALNLPFVEVPADLSAEKAPAATTATEPKTDKNLNKEEQAL